MASTTFEIISTRSTIHIPYTSDSINNYWSPNIMASVRRNINYLNNSECKYTSQDYLENFKILKKKLYFKNLDRKKLKKEKEMRKFRNSLLRNRKRHPAIPVITFSDKCYYVYPDISEDNDDSMEGCQNRKAQATSIKQRKNKHSSDFETEKSVLNNKYKKKIFIDSPRLDEETIRFLLFKLSLKIKSYRDVGVLERLLDRYSYRFNKQNDSCVPVPQMETQGIIEQDTTTIDQKGNAVLVQSGDVSEGIPHNLSDNFKQFAISRQEQVFSTFTDRWLRVGSYKWKLSHLVNDQIFNIDLPYQPIHDYQESPNVAIIMNNRLFRTDMLCKFVLNSSPWQVGSAVIDWCYGANKQYQNVWTALQRNHCRLNLGSSNNAELFIPYHHYNSYLSNATSQCSLGSITCRVLNPMRMPEGVSSSASVTVFVCFQNIDTHGLISRKITYADIVTSAPQGQMDEIGTLCRLGSSGLDTISKVANEGSNLLNTAAGVMNRDKPPLPLQPTCLIPQSVTSFSYTDGIVEPINVLRSDPRGQRPSSNRGSEMSLIKLAQGWGFLKSYPWAFTHNPGDLLFQIPVTPFIEDASYYGSNRNISNFEEVVLPPVSFVSSLVSKVRGNVDFRLEVIANSFYTGSIQISGVPLFESQYAMKFSDAMYSSTYVLDIAKTSVIDISVPWNWYNAWMRTPNIHRVKPNYFAFLYVYVLNPLVAVQGVSPIIDINVFIKAGENFEVCQLHTPIISMDLTVLLPPKDQFLKPYNFEDRWYTTSCVDTWGKKFAWTNIYVGNVSNGWVGYQETASLRLYELQKYLYPLQDQIEFRCPKIYYTESTAKDGKKTKEKVTGYIKYGIHHESLKTSNAEGLVVFMTLTAAKAALTHFQKKGFGKDFADDFLSKYPDERFQEDSDWSQVKYNNSKEWVTADNRTGIYPLWKEMAPFTSLDSSFEMIDSEQPTDVPVGQMDRTEYTITNEVASPKTAMGLNVYGESMTDLKGISRRWQHYDSYTGLTCPEKYPRDCGYLFKLPVRPWHKMNPQHSQNYDNRIREGSISLINNLFAFWEGGIRYRFVVTHDVPVNSTIYTQHRFDDEKRTIDNIILGSRVLASNQMMDTHYSTFVQALDINPIATIEVPYMRSEERLVTWADPSGPTNNGHVYVWVHSPKQVNLNVEIYYCCADDFTWSVFQGVPFSFNINSLAPEPQMDVKGDMMSTVSGFFTPSIVKKLGDSSESVAQTSSVIQETSQNIEAAISTITEDISITTNKMSESLDKGVGVAASVGEAFNSLASKLSTTIDKLTSTNLALSESQKKRKEAGYVGNILDDLKESTFDYLTHIVYVLINPTKGTISWCLINLYRNVFGFTFNGLVEMQTYMGSLWERARQANQQPQPVGQMEDGDVTSLCSLLYCATCTLLGLKVKPPTSWSNISDGLFRFSNYARGSAFVSSFLKDNISLLKRIWQKIVSIFGYGNNNYKLISGIEDKRLQQWLLHTTAMLNPCVRDKIYTNPLWAEKIFCLGVLGRMFVMTLSQEPKTPTNLMRLVNDSMKSLRKLEQELVNRNVFCGERYEPYCLWVAGNAGTGKTRYLQNFAESLSEYHQSKSVQSYHTLTINQKYFDGFVGQPSVLIDDFLTLSPLNDETAGLFIQMKSSALFNPPYSDVKDKARLVNFYNLLISSNFKEVSSLAGIHDTTAYNRRRDDVISFEMRESEDKTKKLAKDYTMEQCQRLEQAVVYHHPDSVNTAVKNEIKRVEGEDYNVTVTNFLLARAKEYHMKETASFALRIKKKQERIDSLVSKGESLKEYLDSTFKLLNWTDKLRPNLYAEEKLAEIKDALFGYWRVPQSSDLIKVEDQEEQGEPSTSNIVGQMEPYATWPTNVMDPVDFTYDVENTNYKDVEGIEKLAVPLNTVYFYNRETFGLPPFSEEAACACAHSLAASYIDKYEYDCRNRVFKLREIYEQQGVDFTKLPTSFSVERCWTYLDGSSLKIGPHPECIFIGGKPSREDMKDRLIEEAFKMHGLEFHQEFNKKDYMTFDRIMKATQENSTCALGSLPPSWIIEWSNSANNKKQVLTLSHENERLKRTIVGLQIAMQKNIRIIGEFVLPSSAPKTFSQKLWEGFLRVVSLMQKAFDGLFRIILFFSCLSSALLGGWCLYNRSEIMPKEPMPQLHPSGDFKTLRSRPSQRQSALQLIKGQAEDVSDAALIRNVQEIYQDPSTDGRLRKIVSNVFTMVGMRYTTPDRKLAMTYKVRCLGLYQYKFICLKHYLDYFKGKGVTHVALIYRKGKGVVRFSLDELEFEWTSAGYGVGVLPPAAMPFKNITKFIPSESFDGNYPYEMVMVEVFMDEIRIHPIECEKIRSPVKVPPNGEQGPWIISQGFTYKWEGMGRCGSFLFAPKLASPLVAIHTSGVQGIRGYGEMLLRETFIRDDIEIDYVVPQMQVNERGFEPKGNAYVLGHLKPNESVNIPTKTKIIPSEIHGVFEVATEPAPLSYSDPRLVVPFDPLEEGISKRCDKPDELPPNLLQESYLDFADKLLKCKPLKEPCKLSISEAVEGLTLPNYEPLEIKTSEGYPWVLERPKNATDKSWMFKFSEYEDGRRKLEGIYGPLKSTLELKDNMRQKGIVPLTYATACLKDARILKEKINKPGSTRVFEMCPVEMTIAQRQYFMDYYAAYKTSKFSAEHTIGINPDGPEWSELANYLTEFSPYILTADYSGYGPRLLKSVQLKALMIEVAWYEHWQTKLNMAEELIEKEFRNRYSFVFESLHHPVVCKDAVVYFNVGQDSGNPATVERNSHTNSLMIRTIYLFMAKRKAPQYACMFYFNKFVRMLTNGDDLIMAVKEEIIEWFNNETLIEAFAQFNIKMTDALKSGKVRRYCSIEEATYLKRSFKPHPTREGQWLAPLEDSSVKDTANWIWRCVNERLASLVNSEQCVRLAYSNGPEYYNDVAEKVKRAWRRLGVEFNYPSWEAIDVHVWEQLDGPTFSYV